MCRLASIFTGVALLVVASTAAPAAAGASGGTLDPGFGSGGVVAENLGQANRVLNIRSAAVNQGGSARFAGFAQPADPDVDGFSDPSGLAAYGPDGSPDLNYGVSGIAMTPFGDPVDPAGPTDHYVIGHALPTSDGGLIGINYAYPPDSRLPYALTISRLDGTGRLDTRFSGDGITKLGGFEHVPVVDAATVDGSDRPIFVVGSEIYRLTAAGVLDSSFGPGGKRPLPAGFGDAMAITAAPDGRFVVAGSVFFSPVSFARFSAGGQLDTSFGDAGVAKSPAFPLFADRLAIDGQNRVVFAGGDSSSDAKIGRLTAGGDADGSIGGGDGVTEVAGHYVTDLRVDSQNRILALEREANGFDTLRLQRLSASNGSPDLGFSGDGSLTIAPGVGALAGVLAAGAGPTVAVSGQAEEPFLQVRRYQADGEPDPTFGGGDGVLDYGTPEGTSERAVASARDAAGRLLVTGTRMGAFETDIFVRRYLASGALDTSFAAGGTRWVDPKQIDPGVYGSGEHRSRVRDIAIDSEGRILLVGRTGFPHAFVVRLSAAGAVDPTFAGDGVVTLSSNGYGVDEFGTSVAIDSQDRVIVGATVKDKFSNAFLYEGAVYRLRENGSPDPAFNGSAGLEVSYGEFSFVRDVAVGAGDRVAVALTTGSSDFPDSRHGYVKGFTSTGNTIALREVMSEAKGLAVDPQGRILALGTTGSQSSGRRLAVARLQATSFELDRSFGGAGTSETRPSLVGTPGGVTVAAGGRVLAAGTVGDRATVVAYTSGGAIDPSYGTAGVTQIGFPSNGSGLTPEPNGAVTLGGGAARHGHDDLLLARLTAGGAQPPTLSVDPFYISNPFTEALESDGRLTGPGISCPGDCVQAYDSGATVTLEAEPDRYFTLKGWGGACSGKACTLTMSSHKYVTASFEAASELQVTVSGSGSGSVAGAGVSCTTAQTTCTQERGASETVTLTATAAPGSRFRSWIGCPSPSGAICTVPMNQDRRVAAEFISLAAPDTTIESGPKKKSKTNKAKFTFSSSERDSRFFCSLDRAAEKQCGARYSLKRLKVGKHRLSVVAEDDDGNRDPTPATYSWKVKKKK